MSPKCTEQVSHSTTVVTCESWFLALFSVWSQSPQVCSAYCLVSWNIYTVLTTHPNTAEWRESVSNEQHVPTCLEFVTLRPATHTKPSLFRARRQRHDTTISLLSQWFTYIAQTGAAPPFEMPYHNTWAMCFLSWSQGINLINTLAICVSLSPMQLG